MPQPRRKVTSAILGKVAGADLAIPIELTQHDTPRVRMKGGRAKNIDQVVIIESCRERAGYRKTIVVIVSSSNT